MNEIFNGFHALYISLPLSGMARRWRKYSRRIRGKSGGFLQETTLPEVDWKACIESSIPRLYETYKANGNVRISELAILSALARRCRQGSNLFEIGTFDGRTTLNLALNAHESCRILTLDLPPGRNTKHRLACGEGHMVEKPVPGLRYEKYRAEQPERIGRIRQFLADSAVFDFGSYDSTCSLVFVDGSHAYEYAQSDTQKAFTLVEPGGVIIWHDYGIWDGVTTALEELEKKESLGLRNIKGTSLVIWQKTKESNNSVIS